MKKGQRNTIHMYTLYTYKCTCTHVYMYNYMYVHASVQCGGRYIYIAHIQTLAGTQLTCVWSCDSVHIMYNVVCTIIHMYLYHKVR